MNRGEDSLKSRHGGYTIIEVLIFLGVSALLFVSTMLMLSGRQQRAQFVNAVRDFETKLTDVANDVANGYYQPGDDKIACTQGPIVVYDDTPDAGQGEHERCIFLGRLVKLGELSPTPEGYGVYSIVGNRQTASNVNVADLGQANPKLLWTADASTNNNLREQKQFGFGTSVACVGINANTCDPDSDDNAGVAFMSTITGNLQPGRSGSGIRTELHVFSAMQISDTPGLFRGDINSTSAVNSAVICLLSGSTDQYALIHLGNAGGSGLTVTSEIKEGKTCV